MGRPYDQLRLTIRREYLAKGYNAAEADYIARATAGEVASAKAKHAATVRKRRKTARRMRRRSRQAR